MDDDQVAALFHETYERLAPEHGYETRVESAVPWAEVPEQNRGLMRAVVHEVVRPMLDAIEFLIPPGKVLVRNRTTGEWRLQDLTRSPE